MLNRFAFRVFCAADTTVAQANNNAQQQPRQKKPYVIKKGSADEELVKALKRHKGEMTVEELAGILKTRQGEAMKPDSLRSQISKVRGALIRQLTAAGIEKDKAKEKVNSIMPKGFGEGGRGRRAEKAAMGADDILDLLGDDE